MRSFTAAAGWFAPAATAQALWYATPAAGNAIGYDHWGPAEGRVGTLEIAAIAFFAAQGAAAAWALAPAGRAARIGAWLRANLGIGGLVFVALAMLATTAHPHRDFAVFAREVASSITFRAIQLATLALAIDALPMGTRWLSEPRELRAGSGSTHVRARLWRGRLRRDRLAHALRVRPGARLTLLCGFLVIANPFSRNPVTSAMFLVLTIVNPAGLFVLLHAFFLAAVQILVYAGAVMVLFLFVIMLLDLKEEERRKFGRAMTVLSVIAGFVIMRWRREHKPSPLGRERLFSAIADRFPLEQGGFLAQVNRLAVDVTEWAVAPLRRIIPPVGMIDISFLVLVFGLFLVRGVIC